MGHGREKSILDQDCGLQGLVVLTQSGFEVFALRHVPNGADHPQSVRRMQRAQADFNRKLGLILAQTVQFSTLTHWPDVWIDEVVLAIPRMIAVKPRRDKKLH